MLASTVQFSSYERKTRPTPDARPHHRTPNRKPASKRYTEGTARTSRPPTKGEPHPKEPANPHHGEPHPIPQDPTARQAPHHQPRGSHPGTPQEGATELY